MVLRYVRQAIRDLSGYVPGEQLARAGVVKLNTNENPYPPSPRVQEAIAAAARSTLQRYPDPMAAEVRQRAAARYGVDVTQVLVGNGSDELLGLVMRACVERGTRVAYPVPTYSLYDTLVALQEGTSVHVPYGADWSLPRGLLEVNATLTCICRPNSPSGTAVALGDVEAYARSSKGLVLVDEAYADFGEDTALPLVSRLDNVIVLRSFAKSFSLAGLRIGLAVGTMELIEVLARIKDSYNINRISLAAAAAALDDYEWMQANVERIRITRERLTRSLKTLRFEVAPSHANFVFARRPGTQLEGLYLRLRAQGILVRYFATPELRDGLRITVGSDTEIDALLDALAREGDDAD
jgi:histidinol-phosphate aminotransferase